LEHDMQIHFSPSVADAIGPVRANPGSDKRGNRPFAILPLGPLEFYLTEAPDARELLAAAFAALQILDPDGSVIVRTTDQGIHAIEEILPGLPDMPAPELVIPPAGPGGEKGGYSPPERVYDLGSLPNAPAGPAPGAGAR
jgi:hypothetical protein